MNRIKEVLKEKGIKQIWLSEQLGKSYNMVNSYVQNKRQPSIECLYEIAEILKIEAKDLLIDRKENKYHANLINNTTARSGEIVFGDSMSGIKGFYATVKVSTDSTTNVGGLKELFAVSSNYVESSY